MEIADRARRYPIAGEATKHDQDFAGTATGRPKATQPSATVDPATGRNMPESATGQHMEAMTFGHGDDAGCCSNGLSVHEFRAATPEERTVYRKWTFGVAAFYAALLLIGGMAVTIDSRSNSTKFTAASTQRAAGSHRTN